MTALLLIPYFVIGLFISRWWWRRDGAQDSEATILAFGILICWPGFLVGLPTFMFVRWFYSRPPRKRS